MYIWVYVCVYTYELKIQIHNVHIERDNAVYWKTKGKINNDLQCSHTYVYIYTYIHKCVLYIGRPTSRNTCVPVITGPVSLEMRVMERATRMRSSCRPASGRITRVRASTMASALW